MRKEEIEGYINRALESIQKGELPPSQLINKQAPLVEFINDTVGTELLVRCPTCDLPFWGGPGGYKSHVKYCDGIPTLKVYRNADNKAWVTKRYNTTIKDLTKKEEVKELTVILSEALKSDSWEQYMNIVNANKIYDHTFWLKECGLYDTYLIRHKDMKSKKWRSTINCDYCDKSYEEYNSQINEDFNYCSSECSRDHRWGQKYGTDNNYNEWAEHKSKNFREYRYLCEKWMRRNLRKYKPDEWKYYKETPGMSIDHHYFPVIAGFKRMTNPCLTSHSENLRIIPRSENSSKGDKIYRDGMPGFLVKELNKPIILQRIKFDGPPKKVTQARLLEIKRESYTKSICLCKDEYYVEESTANNQSEYCDTSCEGIGLWESGQVHNMITNRIMALDWNSLKDLEKEVAEYFNVSPDWVYTVRNSLNYTLPDKETLKQEKFLVENAYNYTFPGSYEGPFGLKRHDEVKYYSNKLDLLKVLGFNKGKEE
jgi:hypothetical protein